MQHGRRAWVIVVAVTLTTILTTTMAGGSTAAGVGSGRSGDDGPRDHWTPARVAEAVPRDLVIDESGRGYLRGRDGALAPYGHDVAAQHAPLRAVSPEGRAKPGGGGGNDTTPPLISAMSPGSGETIGAEHQFSAVVTDTESGVRSVTFVVTFPGGGQSQSFAPSRNGDLWSVTIQGFTDGAWSWHVVAKDNASKGGNTATSATVAFAVSTAGGGGGGGAAVANAEWTSGGAVQTALGRIYFEMPANRRQTRWTGYVCSGTVVTDAAAGRSVILTAAHCVYDDVNKAFARHVLFVPNQAGTSGSATDLNCTNDPLGCWTPSFGVVDADWADRKFPANIAWDYAFYVVDDVGAHSGTGPGGALDAAAGHLPVQFTAPRVGDVTHALGYSYSEDPKLMFCAEAMGTEGSVNWWLPSCLLSGGSSGGAWVQPMDLLSGSGPIVSVNSWGYTGSAGMAGPILSESSASCLFAAAKAASLATPNRGTVPAGC